MAQPREIQKSVLNKADKIGRRFTIGSWNLQGGLTSQHRFELLATEMKNKKIHVCCFQETRHNSEYLYQCEDGGKIICMAQPEPNISIHQQYGQGFYLSRATVYRYYDYKCISNRISILRLTLSVDAAGKHNLMTIINAYAPTAMLVNMDEAVATNFYEQLQHVYEQYNRRSSITIIAGDMNSKIGKKMGQEDTFMGEWAKGTRNHNGENLAEFLVANQLYLSNTHFQHQRKHMTTWEGVIPGFKAVRNQIDYIAVQRRHKDMMRQSRSHKWAKYDSDHRVVITRMDLNAYYRSIRKKMVRAASELSKRDYNELAKSKDMQRTYAEKINRFLELAEEQNEGEDDENSTPKARYTKIVAALSKSAEEVIPLLVPLQCAKRVKFTNDARVLELSSLQCGLRNEILQRTGRANATKIKQLKRRRARTSKLLNLRIRQLQNQRVDSIAAELERTKHEHKVFQAQRLLRQQSYKPFSLQDNEGHVIADPTAVVTQFYERFFNQEGERPVPPWVGPARPLAVPVTAAEVMVACGKLNNQRATGKDGVKSELLKYGGEVLWRELAATVNAVFEQHQHLDEIGEGVLCPLNKPGKGRTVEHTRPITLLNSVRKMMSLVTLERIYEKINRYVSNSQSGFRRNRGAADVLWTYRFLMATATKYHKQCEIMGIDMSKAFDCMFRHKALTVLQGLLDESEFRMVTYLLANTTLEVKVGGKLGPKFRTTIGTPQGDSLSPVLFIIYLEAALRDYQQRFPAHNNGQLNMRALYADDTDFIKEHRAQFFSEEYLLPPVFKEWNLVINAGKTEFTGISRGSVKTLTGKKLGSKLGDMADIQYRIQQARVAFGRMWKIWINNKHIRTDTKIKLYNPCVKSILTYNMGASGASDAQLERLNTAHRRHLRQLKRVHHPNHISNSRLYESTNSHPVIEDVHKLRWKLFGHILRGPLDSPANFSIMHYVTPHDKGARGAPMITLPVVLHKQLQLVDRSFKTVDDAGALWEIAQDRARWRELWKQIVAKVKDEAERKKAAPKRRRVAAQRAERVMLIGGRRVVFRVERQVIRVVGVRRGRENEQRQEAADAGNGQREPGRHNPQARREVGRGLHEGINFDDRRHY